MVSFFRRIRQQLLKDNRFGRYLLYALGEVILVVIGIFLALQLNILNEARKAKKQEITLLENFKKDLNLDTLDIGFNLKYHSQFINEEKKLLNFLMNDLDEPEAPIDYNASLTTPLVIVLHESTFANLQANDIGILTNNDLRKDISRFYDFFATAIQKIENDLTDYETYNAKLPFFFKYFKLDPEAPPMLLSNPDSQDYYNPDFEKQSIMLYKVNEAKADEAFKLLLNESIFFRQVTIDFYVDMINRINELNLSIDEELESLRN